MTAWKLRVFGGLLLAGLLTPGLACSDDADDGDESTGSTGEPRPPATSTETPATGAPSDRAEFVTTVDAQLEQLQGRFDQLQEEIDTMSGDSRAEAQARLQVLRDTKVQIEAELQGIEAAADPAYQERKAQIEGRMEGAMAEAEALADEIGI